jgi:uncharacterized protein YqjF (DUF2071 family)
VSDDFNYAILNDLAHRPWTMPDRPWVMTQTWHDLLFAHWPVDQRQLRSAIPPAFELDLFDGTAWVGMVPFRMTNVSLRGVPSLPWVSAFLELNVRTYVRVADRPGVYFFSLDAGGALAVLAARTLLRLPYYWALMKVSLRAGAVEYDSRRRSDGTAALTATYRPSGPVVQPLQGSLEHFLTERYCLYNVGYRGASYRLEIHHPPWPLQAAEAEFVRNGMAEASGVTLPAAAPLLHYAKRQDVVAWLPERLASPTCLTSRPG